MLDDFDDIRLRDLIFFDRLVALGNITAAARELEIPKPTASRWLANLEARVGHSLVHRTTRHMAPTDRGRAFHLRAQDVLATARAARIVAQGTEPGGVLRVSIPVPLGRMLARLIITGFRADLPSVRLELRSQNERVDLVRDRVDVAIRGGPLPDTNLVARRLAEVRLWLYASASLRGSALADLPLIATPGDVALLRTRGKGTFQPTVVVDDRSSVADALVAGAGFGLLPAFLAEPARAQGDLIRLEAEPLAIMPVHALFLRTLEQDLRIRVLIDHVRAGLSEALSEGGEAA